MVECAVNLSLTFTHSSELGLNLPLTEKGTCVYGHYSTDRFLTVEAHHPQADQYIFDIIWTVFQLNESYSCWLPV